MENHEQRVDSIKYLGSKLRYITLAVQIMPSVYSFIYILCLVAYLFCSEPILVLLNTLSYVSPVVIIGFLIESKILKLCKWHKTACILPILPQILVFVDYYIIELTEIEAYIAIATPIALSILLLIAAYNVFVK